MKRIDEKVKDIVEVRSHGTLIDFAIDPIQTLAGYHFTDITSDLMSKWINGAIRVSKGSGEGFALAGFRGVGKSHFLAAFGAILGHPEIRSRISDSHVSSAAQSLTRRSHAVAFLRRGSQDSLLAELKDAVAPLLGSEPAALSDSLNELLLRANECAGDLPFVLLIDTASERSSRVSRDDGHLLSAIAEAAKALGIFVGIALDDDISGADGANSAISRSFVIDYLDQEHLYKIVDNHIFPKQARMQPVLQQIYEYYRGVIPNFRWSEERFRSLYPLHPAIMEVAPFVRLYMHEFALLNFAAEAGSRILGRPANSLIAPDEVFDKVEKSLRRVDALKGAFAAFDKINTEVVVKTPVMKRLQAKLILKGLFLFSLNDEGATAVEIAASTLIFDENDPEAAIRDVESLMAAFAAASPEGIAGTLDANGLVRYRFKLDGKDDLKTALDEAGALAGATVVDDILRKLMDDRFSDCSFVESGESSSISSSDCQLEWRGGLRKGKIYWPTAETTNQFDSQTIVEWKVALDIGGRSIPVKSSASELPVVVWKSSELRTDEIETLKRYHVLLTDPAIRTDFEEHIAAAVQAHILSVEKILQRVFLDDGVLLIEGFEYNFVEEARTAHSFSQIFTIMLESLFEGRFPLHPYFSQMIRMKDVSNLVADLFGGARPNLEEVQHMAETYALPLGIVAMPGSYFIPAEAETLQELPLVRDILDVIKSNKEPVSLLNVIFARLGEAPYGLVHEAGYLLLAAMVSGRLLDFVTSNGDRISHRSLDLQLIWDDIIGIAIPAESAYSNERLVMWGTLLTGNLALKGLNKTEDRLNVLQSLQDWLAAWNSGCLSDRFDAIRDDRLNTNIWRLARNSIKAFRIAADSIAAVVDSSLPIEGCLQRVADAFADSDAEFARFSSDLATVEEFITGTILREEVGTWLSLCEITGIPEIDAIALLLGDAIGRAPNSSTATCNDDIAELWTRFKSEYSAYFVERHDLLLSTPTLRDKLDEIHKTDLWWEFENLCGIPAFDRSFKAASRSIVKRIKQFDCKFDTDKILATAMPVCGCSFTLGQAETVESLPQTLWETVNEGLASYRQTLRLRKDELVAKMIGLPEESSDGSAPDARDTLTKYLSSANENRRLSNSELSLIRNLFAMTSNITTEDVYEIDEIGPFTESEGFPVSIDVAEYHPLQQ